MHNKRYRIVKFVNRMKIFVALASIVCCCVPSTTVGLENGLARTPPMGWLSWQRFACNIDCDNFPNDCINQRLYQTMADKLVELKLIDFGYNYVNIDDCWSNMKRDDNTQQLVANKARFPDDIPALVDYMHSRHLKLGLYGDCGTATCAGYPAQLIPGTKTTQQTQTALNKGGDYFEIDAATLVNWKIDSFKFDGCFIDPFYAETKCPEFTRQLTKVSLAKKRPVLLTCEWVVYMLHANRTAHVDWKLAADSCNLMRFTDDVLDNWARVLFILDTGIEHQHSIAQFHGPGSWFDPDMLMLGNFGLSANEEAAQMAIWSMWSAPLFMSNDLRALSDSSLALLKNRNLIEINQDAMGVFALMVGTSENGAQAFVKPVLPIRNACPSFAVLYLNRETLGNGKVVSFKLSQLLANKELLEIAANNSKRAQQKEADDDKVVDALFDAEKCLSILQAGNATFEVWDLMASSTSRQKLDPIKLVNSLYLNVEPSGVRVVKLEQ